VLLEYEFSSVLQYCRRGLLVLIVRCIENGGVRETTCFCLNDLGPYSGTSSRTHFSAGAHSPVIDEYRSMLKDAFAKVF
jgi:hypothetical protein